MQPQAAPPDKGAMVGRLLELPEILLTDDEKEKNRAKPEMHAARDKIIIGIVETYEPTSNRE